MTMTMGAAGITATIKAESIPPALDTTVTVNSIIIDNYGSASDPDFHFYNGYKANSSSHPILSFGDSGGSIADATFDDGVPTSRTIVSIGYSEEHGLAPAAETDNIYFVLDGTGISDSDTTFVSIEYNGVTYTRASRSSYTNPSATESAWQWDNVATNGPTDGSRSLIVNV